MDGLDFSKANCHEGNGNISGLFDIVLSEGCPISKELLYEIKPERGQIESVNSDGTYTIEYDSDGKKETYTHEPPLVIFNEGTNDNQVDLGDYVDIQEYIHSDVWKVIKYNLRSGGYFIIPKRNSHNRILSLEQLANCELLEDTSTELLVHHEGVKYKNVILGGFPKKTLMIGNSYQVFKKR